MCINLYDYQETVVKEARRALINCKGVMVCAPTGSGKSVMIAEITRLAADKGKKVLILVHRGELLQSNSKILKLMNIRFGFIASSLTERKGVNVVVAMAQTLKRRTDKEYYIKLLKSFDVVVIDEAHNAECDYFFKDGDGEVNVSEYFSENCKIVGMSATPRRKGRAMQLADIYEKMVLAPSVKEIVDLGKLVPCDAYGMESESMEGVKVVKGDFDSSEQFKKVNKPANYSSYIREWRDKSLNKPTIIFAVSVDHAAIITQTFVDNGISAKYIVSRDVEDYEHLTGSRYRIIKEWRANEFFVLVNVGIFTTGFDRPDIQTVGLARATKSLPLYLQMIGRGSRTFAGKTHFTLLDFGGNLERHGEFDDEREWSLIHKTGPRGEARYKICPNPVCEAYIFAQLKICPKCQYKYPEDPVEFQDMELVSYSKSGMSLTEAQAKLDFDNPKLIETIITARGYKMMWVVNFVRTSPKFITDEDKIDALTKWAQYRKDNKIGNMKHPKVWSNKQILG